MRFVSMLSFISATRFIALVAFDIFKELEINVKAYQVVNVSPSHQHMSNFAHDTATVIVARKKTYDIDIYIPE